VFSCNSREKTLFGGAKVLVSPSKLEALKIAIRLANISLKKHHVLVSPEIEDVVTSLVQTLPRCEKVRRRGKAKKIPIKFAMAAGELSVPVVRKGTFLHVEVPSSLRSESSNTAAVASTTEAHGGQNPRKA